MKFKIISIIFSFYILNTKVIASPIKINQVDNDICDADKGNINLLDDNEECLTQECFEVSKRIITNMDINVNPCEDFYQFVCGGWMNENDIDDEELSKNAFINGRKRNVKIIKDILEGDINIDEFLSLEDQEYEKININKIKNLYNTCKNVDRIDEKGKKPLLDLLNKLNLHENIENYKTKDGLTNLLNKLFRNGIAPLLKTGTIGDLSNSTIHVLALTQSTLFFAKESYEKPDVISHYKVAIYGVLKNIYGDERDGLKDMANSIADFEQNIANISIPKSKLQSPTEYYNRYNIKKLNTDYPYINWTLFFENLIEYGNVNYPINDDTLIINFTPKYFEDLNNLLIQTDIKTLVNYFEFIVIRNYINYISKDMKQPLKIFSNYLNGETSEKPIEEQCVNFVNTNIGKAITKYYLKIYYDDKIKESNEQIIENIKESMIERIPKMTWLDEKTRYYAIHKINNISNNIGYPDYVLDSKEIYKLYEGLETVSDDYFTNIVNLSRYNDHKNLKRLEEPVDKTEWGMNPHEVNAYYRPTANTINFPAGIFQPPFYSPNVPDYLTYGGIGMVIGHELIHSLDKSGKQFDEHGDLYPWWNDSTEQKFNELSQCFINQYNNYYIDEENHVNGELTLNENLADNGGVARAFEAWKLSKRKNPEKAKENNKKLPGLTQFTPEQLFFISFGQDWCTKIRSGYAKERINIDNHSPGKYRVIGVVSNSKQFAKTFKCPANSKMNPNKKCLIW